MNGMRDLLRNSLGRALSGLDPVDRLAAAWPVVLGSKLARHGSISSYVDGVLTIDIDDALWSQEMLSLRERLKRELAHIAAVPIREIHFEDGAGRARRATIRATIQERASVKKITGKPRTRGRA